MSNEQAARVKRVMTYEELLEHEHRCDDPARFQDLGVSQQSALVDWIRDVLVPAKRVFGPTSYGMKHCFEREPDGFYVYNGAFKGAMIAAGFKPVDAFELNWRFRVKPLWPLTQDERRQRGLIGRGWLIRHGRVSQ
jgi:hypothetical protein